MIEIIIILLLCLIIIMVQVQKMNYTGGREYIDKIDNPDTASFIDANKKLIMSVLKDVQTIVNVGGIPENLKYCRSGTLLKQSIHIGQLKLFLSEIQFLTDSLETCTEPAVVIYAGSAPSNKIPYIQKLFPNVKFVLIDPNEHFFMNSATSNQYDRSDVEKYVYYAVSTNTKCPGYTARVSASVEPYINTYLEGVMLRKDADLRIPDNLGERIDSSRVMCHVIEQYMTDDIAEKLAPLCKKHKTLFMSDIRGQLNSTGYPTDYDIIWNSAMMYNWISIMNPTRYMLKFRCPYEFGNKGAALYTSEYNKHKNTHADIKKCGINFLDDIKRGKFVYLKPESVWLQAFAPISSTEVRLVGSGLKLAEMDVKDYEDKIFYFNNIHRQYGYHSDHEDMLNYFTGIDRCGDCGLMCRIVKDYCAKPGAVIRDPGAIITELLTSINRSLVSKGAHGLYFNRLPDPDAIKQNFTSRAATSIYRSSKCLITKPPDHEHIYALLKYRDTLTKKYPKVLKYTLSVLLLEHILIDTSKCGDLYNRIASKFIDPLAASVFKFRSEKIEQISYRLDSNSVRYGDLSMDVTNPSANNLNHYLLKVIFPDFPKNSWENTPDQLLQSARIKHSIGSICELCLCESMRLYTDVEPIFVIDGATSRANDYTLVIFNNYGICEPISHLICQSLTSKYMILFNYGKPIDDPIHTIKTKLEPINAMTPSILSNL